MLEYLSYWINTAGQADLFARKLLSCIKVWKEPEKNIQKGESRFCVHFQALAHVHK